MTNFNNICLLCNPNSLFNQYNMLMQQATVISKFYNGHTTMNVWGMNTCLMAIIGGNFEVLEPSSKM